MKTLKPGDKLPEVTVLQTALNKFGANIKEDGVFGKFTENAVHQFQDDHGLESDGVVGPVTWLALGVSSEGQQTEPPTPPPTDTSEKPRKSTAGNLLVEVPAGALQGVDLSHWEPDCDFNKAKAVISFALTKTSEGLATIDKTYVKHTTNARKAGVPIGGYHFFRVDYSAEAQANFFWKTLVLQKGDIVPTLDFEDHGKASVTHQVSAGLQFLQIIESKMVAAGIKNVPMIYLSRSFQNELGNPQSYFKYWMWQAEYNTKCHVPPPWNHPTIWQNSDKAKVSGIPIPVDHNYLFGGKDLLAKLIV